jgi:hypothetical protein
MSLSLRDIERRIAALENQQRVTAAIADELHKILDGLGASPDLLSIVGSYGDTLSDEEILSLLREYNGTGKVLHERQ